jgi:hypothetical protein
MAKIKQGPHFIRYFDPVIKALKELGGSGTPSEVVEIVARLREKQKGQPLTFEFVVGDKDLNYNDNNMLPNKSLEPIGNKTCLWLSFPLC